MDWFCKIYILKTNTAYMIKNKLLWIIWMYNAPEEGISLSISSFSLEIKYNVKLAIVFTKSTNISMIMNLQR